MVNIHKKGWQSCQIRIGSHCLLGYAALSWQDRARGLLGVQLTELPTFLWFDRCRAVHTIAMQTAIDIVFLSKEFTVLAVHTAVVPWRCRYHWEASSVLELPPHQAGDWLVGERVQLTLV